MPRQEWVGIEPMGEGFLLTFLFIGLVRKVGYASNCAVEQLTRVRCLTYRSQRLSNAACSRCSVPSFGLKHARGGTGSVPVRRQNHGRAARRTVEDRVAQAVGSSCPPQPS